MEVGSSEKEGEKRLRSSRTSNGQCPENVSNMTANVTTEIRRDKGINLANVNLSQYNREESLRTLSTSCSSEEKAWKATEEEEAERQIPVKVKRTLDRRHVQLVVPMMPARVS